MYRPKAEFLAIEHHSRRVGGSGERLTIGPTDRKWYEGCMAAA
jgi:hypothetical protein